MEMFKEIISVLQHVFSANRRAKAIILLKEQWLGLTQLVEKNRRKNSNLPPDAPSKTWNISETRQIDTNYFKQWSGTLIEDRIMDDKTIHTQQNYTVDKIYGATAYTNETTHRSVFNRNDERIDSLSSTRKDSRAPSRRSLPIEKKIPGVTANLYGNIASAEGNYLHWFVIKYWCHP